MKPKDASQRKLWALDPRRSLVAGAMWLIIALVLLFSVVAAVWVGSIARETVFEQHVRRLRLETDQLSGELALAVTARIDALRAVSALLPPSPPASTPSDLETLFKTLCASFPQLDWLAVSDATGHIVASRGVLPAHSDVGTTPWFKAAARRPWLGMIEPTPATAAAGEPVCAALGDLALPIRDSAGRWLGVIVTRASWRRPARHFQRLTDEIGPDTATEAIVLDRDEVVLVGPPSLRGLPWDGVPADGAREPDHAPAPATAPTSAPTSASAPASARAPAIEFERLPDGRRLLVSRVPVGDDVEFASLGWQVQLGEPSAHVYQRADAVALRILWVSLGLGAATALVGIQGARQLTRRLRRLTQSVTQLGENEKARIEVPPGVDEVARLAGAFADILGALQAERRELERRVAIRTREVERLADESRYAAIVRERLKIARDLHDTLAHSMMAMLSEIRLLRRLHLRDPQALAAELQRAEEVAHEGLGAARAAIAQVRSNTVRETGLGPALAAEFKHFLDRTGLSGEFSVEPEAARFGEERGETFVRIAQEVLRNIERHARATQVEMRLRLVSGTRLDLCIADDGVGFDPARIPPGHYGIIGLREQAELIGAELQIESHADRGTRIALSLELAPVAFMRSA